MVTIYPNNIRIFSKNLIFFQGMTAFNKERRSCSFLFDLRSYWSATLRDMLLDQRERKISWICKVFFINQTYSALSFNLLRREKSAGILIYKKIVQIQVFQVFFPLIVFFNVPRSFQSRLPNFRFCPTEGLLWLFSKQTNPLINQPFSYLRLPPSS